MTELATQLAAAEANIGRTAIVVLNPNRHPLKTKVTIVDAKAQFGNVRYVIESEHGPEQTTMDASNVTIVDD